MAQIPFQVPGQSLPSTFVPAQYPSGQTLFSRFQPQPLPSVPSLPAIPAVLPPPQMAAQQVPSVPAPMVIPEHEEESYTAISPSKSMERPAAYVTRIPGVQKQKGEDDLNQMSFAELELMPVRCYGCGKIIRQQAIENSLEKGNTLFDTLNTLQYRRMCCRDLILAQPSVLKLQKKIQTYKNISDKIGSLTLESTGIGGQLGFGGPFQAPKVSIVDDVPPGAQIAELCPVGLDESFMNQISQQEGDVDPFEVFRSRIEEPQEEIEP